MTIVLAKMAKHLMLKIKIISKANQWASKKELLLQELQGYRENNELFYFIKLLNEIDGQRY